MASGSSGDVNFPTPGKESSPAIGLLCSAAAKGSQMCLIAWLWQYGVLWVAGTLRSGLGPTPSEINGIYSQLHVYRFIALVSKLACLRQHGSSPSHWCPPTHTSHTWKMYCLVDTANSVSQIGLCCQWFKMTGCYYFIRWNHIMYELGNLLQRDSLCMTLKSFFFF